MRVAVIPTIREYPWGAPGHCMGQLVEALLENGHDVLWFVAPIDSNNPEVARLAARGATMVSLQEYPPGYGRFASFRRRVRALRNGTKQVSAVLSAYQPEHTFINQGGTWCALEEEYLGFLNSHAGRYSLICHLNQYSRPFTPDKLPRARQFMGDAKRVFFPSNWTRELAEGQIAKNIRQVSYFQYPVRFEFDSPLSWPGSNVPRLALVGRLDAMHKGIDLAFEAIARLKREGVQLRFSLYGNGEDEDYLRKLSSFVGIEDMVAFVGYVANVDDVWLREELLLLPSRFEGSAVALTEAMGFGRPVLTNAVGGAAEWVEDGNTGYVCPAPDVGLLTSTLRRALSERSNWRAMGLEAHAKIKLQLDPKPARHFLQALD